eukprot:11095-Chlamydomonas_euryale.AAC.2
MPAGQPNQCRRQPQAGRAGQRAAACGPLVACAAGAPRGGARKGRRPARGRPWPLPLPRQGAALAAIGRADGGAAAVPAATQREPLARVCRADAERRRCGAGGRGAAGRGGAAGRPGLDGNAGAGGDAAGRRCGVQGAGGGA